MSVEIRFTKKDLESLPAAPAGKRAYYADTRYPGLRVSVTDRGAKSWVYQRRVSGRVRRITLGRYPDMAPERAIKRYEVVRGEIADGADPAVTLARKSARRVTLGEIFETFLRLRPNLKPTTVRTYRQVMGAALGDWQNTPLAGITKSMVADRHAHLVADSGGPYANSAMRTLRSVWNFAESLYEDEDGESLLPANPVQRLSKMRAWAQVKPRKTALKEHQWPAWFEAVQALRAEPWGTPAQTVGDYLMVLLLTGLRRSEGIGITWRNIDLKARTLLLPDTKNRDDHLLPLSDYLVELLQNRWANRIDSVYVFPGHEPGAPLIEPRRHIKRVIEHSGVDFRLHDLRRTFITTAEALDLPAYVLSRLANHRSMGHPVTREYIVTDVERLRPPMQKITDYLLSVGGVRPAASVVPLKGKERLKEASHE